MSYQVGDAERNQTIQPGKRSVARGPMDDIAFPKQEARKISAVLPGHANYEGYFA